MNFEEKVNDAAEAIIEMFNECKESGLSVKETFPMIICRCVEINGVRYQMDTVVKMTRI